MSRLGCVGLCLCFMLEGCVVYEDPFAPVSVVPYYNYGGYYGLPYYNYGSNLGVYYDSYYAGGRFGVGRHHHGGGFGIHQHGHNHGGGRGWRR